MADYKQSKYMTDAVIEQATSLGISPNVRVANAARSGQLGTGIRTTKLDGASPLVFNPAVGVVLTTPALFDQYPKWKEMVVSLIENHAKSITGIDISYSVETADTPVGHDGQTLKVPTRVTRAAVDPSMTFQEYTGNLVWNVFRKWIFAMQNPDTNMSSMPANISNTGDIPEWVISAYSMSMLFIQYDPTGLPDRIVDAVVIVDMFPTGTGDFGLERTINTTKTMERTIPFTGVIQHNENTRLLGMRVAEMLQLHKINMDFSLVGYTGNTTATAAIDRDIQKGGGLNYEANTAPDGIVSRYAPEAGQNYSDTINPTGNAKLATTNIAESNVK